MPSKKEDDKPGRFKSELADYPGYFDLPYPFMNSHVKIWFADAITPLKGLTKLDYAYYEGEWEAAVKLITEYGDWQVEGVKVGELTTGDIPAAVSSWVLGEVSAYVIPFLPPKLRLLASGIL